mmetsp:Transcript_18109/g.20886  ORF Transcript_18109/g.20886 Transcript_18109/m.20886 type:complete len:221 (+) Transcript_18109:104-766(+)
MKFFIFYLFKLLIFQWNTKVVYSFTTSATLSITNSPRRRGYCYYGNNNDDGGTNNEESSSSTTSTIQEIVGLTDKEYSRIVSRIPEIEELSSTQQSLDCVTSLQFFLDLSTIELKKKIVLRLPQILGCYDYTTDIEPNLIAFRTAMGMTQDELKSMVFKCPQLLGLDYTTEVLPNLISLSSNKNSTTTNFEDIKKDILDKPASLNLLVRGGVPSKKKDNK